VPEHWRTFQARRSPLSGSPRLAANPVNAVLNYLYAILEAEARLAAAALGLDPGLGFLHADAAHRDSLAADLMEPVRPQVDAFVLDWILREPIKREWFFEQRDGNCRLMAPFAARLSDVAARVGSPGRIRRSGVVVEDPETCAAQTRCDSPDAEEQARSERRAIWAPARPSAATPESVSRLRQRY
jgi:hypothetical protein